MLTDEEIRLRRDLKLMKEISRKYNIIPPNKVMKVKKRYTRKRKHKKNWEEEYDWVSIIFNTMCVSGDR